jgi:hypothetical protein
MFPAAKDATDRKSDPKSCILIIDEDARDSLALYDALTMNGYEVFVDWIADPDTNRAVHQT